jgi:hypothetical protein
MTKKLINDVSTTTRCTSQLVRSVSNSTATTVPLDDDSVQCSSVASGVSCIMQKLRPLVVSTKNDQSDVSENDLDGLAPLIITMPHTGSKGDGTSQHFVAKATASFGSDAATTGSDNYQSHQGRRSSIVSDKHIDDSDGDDDVIDLTNSSFHRTSERIKDLPRELDFMDDSISDTAEFW